MAKRFSTTNSGPSQRQRRAGELVRHVLAEVMQRGEVHDAEMPNVSITVTEVKMSPDLRNATVFCTALGKVDPTEAIKALNRAAPKIRGVLGRKIELKFTPQLFFRADESFAEAARIEALLRGAGQNGHD